MKWYIGLILGLGLCLVFGASGESGRVDDARPPGGDRRGAGFGGH